MTGPEHYRAAERLLVDAERHNTEHPGDMRIAEITAYCAQVHATLALAAAQAARLADPYIGDGDHINDWRNATSRQPVTKAEEVDAG